MQRLTEKAAILALGLVAVMAWGSAFHSFAAQFKMTKKDGSFECYVTDGGQLEDCDLDVGDATTGTLPTARLDASVSLLGSSIGEAEIEAGKRPPVIHVGDLTPERDFTDVRDIVRAYWMGLEHCSSGEVYNVASGKAYRIQEILDLLLGHSATDVEVREDPERLRPSDVPLLLGDNSKFCEATGWQPVARPGR